MSNTVATSAIEITTGKRGFEQAFEIERIWLLVVIDVWSRTVPAMT